MDEPLPTTPQQCPVCAGRNIRQLFIFQGYPIQQCRDCRLQFMAPQPDDATLQRIYDAHYFLGSEDAEAQERTYDLKRRTAGLYCDTLSRHLGGRTGTLLEIGCGWGDFLLEARRRGFQVSGIEFSPDATAVANRRLEAECVKSGILEENSFEPGSFDVVAFFDVIEHVRDPRQFLQRVGRLIRPGGLMMIVAPSLDSLSARILGRHWMEYKVEHLYQFGRVSIRRALEQIDFSRVTVEANRKILTFDYVERHFARFRVPILSPLLHATRVICPDTLAMRQIMIKASGMLVFAFKN